ELRVYLKVHLPDYMVPAAFVFLDSLPLNTNGKLDRKALPAPDIGIRLVSQYVAPRNSIEEILAKLWAEVLGLEQVGIHDNFFELGGHSLLATQAMARIRLAFDIDLPLSVLLRAPTIAQVSHAVEEAIFDSIQGLTESEAECLLQAERD
ncbi:MAG: phosphopantetheine-binding protein, partial [Nitrosomonas sp.]|nr:phosphopantetheine-binding protein [Nitrosomonas sp.]